MGRRWEQKNEESPWMYYSQNDKGRMGGPFTGNCCSWIMKGAGYSSKDISRDPPEPPRRPQAQAQGQSRPTNAAISAQPQVSRSTVVPDPRDLGDRSLSF